MTEKSPSFASFKLKKMTEQSVIFFYHDKFHALNTMHFPGFNVPVR